MCGGPLPRLRVSQPPPNHSGTAAQLLGLGPGAEELEEWVPPTELGFTAVWHLALVPVLTSPLPQAEQNMGHCLAGES